MEAASLRAGGGGGARRRRPARCATEYKLHLEYTINETTTWVVEHTHTLKLRAGSTLYLESTRHPAWRAAGGGAGPARAGRAYAVLYVKAQGHDKIRYDILSQGHGEHPAAASRCGTLGKKYAAKKGTLTQIAS